MTQRYVFSILSVTLYLAFITPTSSMASDCTATVSYVDAVPVEESDHWTIQFQVEVADCRWSTGRFDFEFTLEDPADDSVQELTKSEAWTENDTSSFTVEYTTQVSGGEFVGDVTVLDDTVICTCRE